MASNTLYQRVGGSGELNSLLFKYKLAKALTMISLMTIIIILVGSIVYSGKSINTTTSDSEDYSFGVKESDDTIVPSADPPASIYGGIKSEDICRLPTKIVIPESPDGSYTPPSPHDSLLKAVQYASTADYDNYCQQWDPVHGFTDAEPYNTRGECGNWQEKYTALHERRLEQLQRLRANDYHSFVHEDKPTYISYLCKEVPANSNRGCGGLADRMSGMISTFFYALLTDRAYLAHWADENPIPLEILFDKPNIDWTYDPREMTALFNHLQNPLLGIERVDTLNQKWPGMGKIIFRDGPAQDFNKLWNGTYIEVRSNRAYIIRTFQESTVYPRILASMGLTKENTFGCLADYLFHPTIGSRRYLNAYRHMFNMDSVLSIGLQIRTDDNALANPQYDDNTVAKWDHFLTCANQLASVHRKPQHQRVVYFLVTDSLKLRDHFVSMNEDRALAKKYIGSGYKDTSMVVTSLPIEHIEPDQIAKYINVEIPKEVTRARMTPGVNSAVVENWLLGHTDYRVISPQGYGKMAAYHSKSDNSTVAMPRIKQKSHAPDCTKASALAKYDWLSTQWSLG
ncbi:hypothetical protein BDF14DRAFT_1886706 [Spinellus fusiger]|nr:hypothetical protein BDF14DRAFT_1886706 [Spinellus fusiger]